MRTDYKNIKNSIDRSGECIAEIKLSKNDIEYRLVNVLEIQSENGQPKICMCVSYVSMYCFILSCLLCSNIFHTYGISRFKPSPQGMPLAIPAATLIGHLRRRI